MGTARHGGRALRRYWFNKERKIVIPLPGLECGKRDYLIRKKHRFNPLGVKGLGDSKILMDAIWFSISIFSRMRTREWNRCEVAVIGSRKGRKGRKERILLQIAVSGFYPPSGNGKVVIMESVLSGGYEIWERRATEGARYGDIRRYGRE